MAITSTCAGCGKTLAVADQFAGRQARCPECGHIYTVPGRPILEGPALTGAASGEQGRGDRSAAPLDLGNLDAGNLDLGKLDRSADAQQYWMRAPNGAEYGPADAQTLVRWFAEGRVGANYEIRQGSAGPWQPATRFQPTRIAPVSQPNAPNVFSSTDSATVNPYAAQGSPSSMGAGSSAFPKGDQSGLVLAMGILSWLACPIFGVVGWIVGAQAIADVRSGQADSRSLSVLQLGYYLSMIHVILVICCVGVVMLLSALSSLA